MVSPGAELTADPGWWGIADKIIAGRSTFNGKVIG
jgi:hypothetical protein